MTADEIDTAVRRSEGLRRDLLTLQTEIRFLGREDVTHEQTWAAQNAVNLLSGDFPDKLGEQVKILKGRA